MFFVFYTVFYTVFARYDAGYADDGYGSPWDESGRACHVTASKTEADKLWARWNDHSWWTDDEYFSVRRGCVEEWNTLSDAFQSEAVAAAEDLTWSTDCEPPAWWTDGVYGPEQAPRPRRYGRRRG